MAATRQGERREKGRILLVGCGQLGSRHLQGVSRLADVAEVVVIDTDPAALSLGRARIAEVPDRNESIRYEWLEGLSGVSGEVDLCVVATLSMGRPELIERVAHATGCRIYLTEKVVAQSVAEYERLLGFAASEGLSVWVNCKTRAYGIHGYFKSKIEAGSPIAFSHHGGNHGLGNNGVHSADLFAFYTGCSSIDVRASQVDPILHPSKRGADYFDLSGTLFGVADDSSTYTLSFARTPEACEHIAVLGSGCRFFVDNMQRYALESYAADGWVWRPVPVEEDWLVSSMTTRFASDILSKGRCDLPTLDECYVSHRFILNALLPHFRSLIAEDLEQCPIT